MADFRKAVFEVCKKLKDSDVFAKTRETMVNLFFESSNEDAAVKKIDTKREIACNGRDLNCEFFGILLAFEKKLSMSNLTGNFCNVELSADEYDALSLGHFVITTFVDKCLSKIYELNPSFAKALNPYSFYVPLASNAKHYDFNESIMDEAITAFKETNIYTYLVRSNFLQALNAADEKTIMGLVQTLDREIIKTSHENPPKEIETVKIKERGFRANSIPDKIDAIAILSFKIIALREMLANAVRLLYYAILGVKLNVIDENCLITIAENKSNIMYEYKTLLIQGPLFNPFTHGVKDIVLFHFEKGDIKYHDFGYIRSITYHFDQSEGHTTKLTYCVLDEELNPIYNLTR